MGCHYLADSTGSVLASFDVIRLTCSAFFFALDCFMRAFGLDMTTEVGSS